jgi:hypothetical protein
MKLAKVTNKFWNKFMVSIYKAREMQKNWDIDEFETFELEDGVANNIEAPQTQAEFERALTSKKVK